MFLNRIFIFGLVILLGIFSISCSRKEADVESVLEPIKIGAIFSVSGPASFLGAPEARTVEMLVERINEQGGILGRKIEFILKDSAGSPERAVSFARQLIEEEQVLAILGPSTSGESMRIKNMCEEDEMILISCAAAEAIVDPVAEWVFKTPQKDNHAVERIFMTMNDLDISKIGIISSNTGFGNAGKSQLEKIAPKFGIEIVISEVYDHDATDLTGVLTKLQAANVEAVINWSIEPAQSIAPRNMKQLNMDVPLFQSHGFGNIRYVDAAGEAGNGIIFPAGRLLIADLLPDNHPQKSVLLNYKNDYENGFNEDVSTFGGHAYDALMILVEAIKESGTVDKYAVRDAIENLEGFVGTAGIFNLSAEDHNGLDLDAFEMLTVKNQKFAIYSGN
jgi:branched-chain amino acid transport system substrate-binding protein